MYRYFISYYISSGNGSFGFGNTETQINREITSVDDIRAIARSLEKDNNSPTGSVVILNYRLF